jgi:DnaJ domain
VNDELIKYYELLGAVPGASMQELKTAHRDLAKVWHPDRFAHDPRLQQKAQEKLKEINEAYDQLISGKLGRRTSRSSPASQSSTPSSTPSQASTRRTPWKFILLSAFALVILFFVASRALIPPGEQTQAQATEERQQSESDVRFPAVEASRSKRVDQQPAREARPSSEPALNEERREVHPLPTVTVTIDPVSGGLATSDCPVKSRMTYPSGAEPRQYCNIAHKSAAPAQEAEQVRSKESRLKSFAKRLAAPARLLGGKGRSDADSRQDAKSPAATDH